MSIQQIVQTRVLFIGGENASVRSILVKADQIDLISVSTDQAVLECLESDLTFQVVVLESRPMDPTFLKKIVELAVARDLPTFLLLNEKRSSVPYASLLSRNYPTVIAAEESILLPILAQMIQLVAHQYAERKRLEANERMLTTLCDHLPFQTAYRIESNGSQPGRFVFLSRGIEDISGLSRQEVMEDSSILYNQIHPEDRPGYDELEREARNAFKPFDAEVRKINARGELKWVHIRSVPWRDSNESVFWDGIETDITLYKEREESVLKLKAGIESVNDAVVITGPSLEEPGPRIEYVNPGFTQLTGYSLPEVLGQPLNILEAPDTPNACVSRVLASLRSSASFVGEVENYRRDGSRYYSDWRVSPIRRKNREIAKWVFIQRDVTERRIHEEYRERTLENERLAREEAERVSRLKDEFLATLSHELRTPINAVLGWSQLLQRGRRTPEEIAKGILIIERNARVQSQLIEDLLDTNRIVSGQAHLKQSPIDIGAIIQSVVQSAQPEASAKSISLLLELPESQVMTIGDPERMQQILWNLLSNALKFTSPGGWVRIRMVATSGELALTVEDNGVGITREFLPFVFDRFRQADASSARRFGGLGLGLSIVKQLVELHGGTISVSSDGEGAGSRFFIRFPRRELGENLGSRSEDIPRGKAISLTGSQILVVDDEPDALGLIKTIVEDCHGIVLTAPDATTALGLLSEPGKVDLIVSDIGLPGISGIELIQEIRKAGSLNQSCPAIAVTAFAHDKDKEQALRAGYNSYLAKPIDAHELVEQIDRLLRETAA